MVDDKEVGRFRTKLNIKDGIVIHVQEEVPAIQRVSSLYGEFEGSLSEAAKANIEAMRLKEKADKAWMVARCNQDSFLEHARVSAMFCDEYDAWVMAMDGDDIALIMLPPDAPDKDVMDSMTRFLKQYGGVPADMWTYSVERNE